MVRRLLMGRLDGVDYGLRVSQAGVDAVGASLDQLLFDSDHYGVTSFAGSEFEVAYNNNAGRTLPMEAASVSVAHGLTGNFVIATIGYPVERSGLVAGWHGWGTGINGTLVPSGYMNSAGLNWVTPHYFDATHSVTGAIEQGGWYISWNSGYLFGYNYCAHPVKIRWRALRY